MEKGFSLADMRNTYRMGELKKADVHPDPFHQFNRWMQQAVEDNLFEPNAMSLATADASGKPSCRTVLLKGLLEEGFIFYSNYLSKKGEQIRVNPQASLLFWWREHERQIRIEGKVTRLHKDLSADYFNQRPKGSRLAAMISPQSQVVKNREFLEQRFLEADAQFRDKDPECPDYWGGFILEPQLFEFWQGRPNRLHDRIQYTLEEGQWRIVRLAP